MVKKEKQQSPVEPRTWDLSRKQTVKNDEKSEFPIINYLLFQVK